MPATNTPTRSEMMTVAQAMLAHCAEDRARIDHIEALCHSLIESISRESEGALEAPLQSPVQPSQHLRDHRPGRPKSWPLILNCAPLWKRGSTG